MQRTPLAFYLAIAFFFSHVNTIASAEDKSQTLEFLLAEARAAQSKRDFPQAAAAYRKAVVLEPLAAELWANLGLMDHESGNPQEAMKSFQKAIHLNASLFVPQLFVGIEYLDAKEPEHAVPFLERAVKLNPKDVLALRSLGKANASLGHGDLAAESYWKVAQSAPNDGGAWLDLGTTYLQQVENDAREMTSTYGDSAYAKLRAAEVLAQEGKLAEAEKAYKASLSLPSSVPCRLSELGITLLRENELAAARERFEQEIHSSSHCELAALGLAVADVRAGDVANGLKRLTSVAKTDRRFAQSSLPLFRNTLSPDQTQSLMDAPRVMQNAETSVDVAALVESAFLSEEIALSFALEDGTPAHTEAPSHVDVERLLTAGRYGDCNQALKPMLPSLTGSRLQMLAVCSFYAPDFKTTSLAAQRLKRNPGTRALGLYWESKADQELAIGALTRAGQIDADSPRMHVLLGDVFREKRQWEEAKAEYKKALALTPVSRGARLGLAITLFAELKNDEALAIAKSLLSESAIDPEANLLAGEILVQNQEFAEAESYLHQCAALKPELMPRCHALLGNVFAETNRTPAAISEYKLALTGDEDGKVHYQLGRLYMKSGSKAEAQQVLQESKRLANRRNPQARAAPEQSITEVSRP